MSRNRIYYHVKPFLPWNFRMAMRRILARRIRKASQDVWPIKESAARTPESWPGWPEGKKFAFILTHDVEGSRGVAKCEKLMELEKSLGFRSSFNFIPEGEYRVTSELRQKLVQNGCEVGIHDLHHDGKLYWTREGFSAKAARINEYAKEWNVVGFRSAFMLHKLDWLHELNVQYDASTFDTDPFEPQPDDVATIFPFWVPCPAGQVSSNPGYVELPYTLVQDSTLFLTLREPTPEIWLRKLDWIVQHGGMALLNLHPDYIQFDGDPKSGYTFPENHYRTLLEYVRKKYGDSVWHVLPGELCAWYRSHLSRITPAQMPVNILTDQPSPAAEKVEKTLSPVQVSAKGDSLKGKRAAVVLYGPYPDDARPRRELQALLDEGASVDLICLREHADEPIEENHGLLHITRAPMQHERSSKLRYYCNYASFLLRAFGLLTIRTFRRRYHLVHVHNMPDVLVFSALVPRLFGAKVVLDLHDPMPELYQTIYKLHPKSGVVRILMLTEKLSIGFADMVLTTNEAFLQLFSSRSGCGSKMHIVINTPDERVFSPAAGVGQIAANGSGDHPNRFRLMYHGTIAKRHGLDTALDAMSSLSPTLPSIVLDVYGANNNYTKEFLGKVKQQGLESRIRYQGFRRLDQIPAAISEADLGIIPNLRTPFTEINFPTRIFEYLSMGKPCIVPETRGIKDYFDKNTMLFFNPESSDDLARMIRWVYEHPDETKAITQRGQQVYHKYLWASERKRFLNLIHSLIP